MKSFVTGMLLVATMPVFAEGKATIDTGNGQETMQMVLHWTEDNMRMDFPAQQHGYLLLRDGKGYMVAQQGDRTVITETPLLKTMSDDNYDDTNPSSASQAKSVENLEATGDTETIAGIEGEVYRIEWLDRSGETHENELVLSDDPLARGMLRAFQGYLITVTGEIDPIGDALLERDLGMLRFNDRFNVVELADASADAVSYDLPENGVTMNEMAKQMKDELPSSR